MGDDQGDSLSLLAGRYRLGALLGSGGMAEVRRAEDTRLGRTVAVKLLKAELAADPSFRDRFEAEGRAAARLAHRNVVGVYDVGEAEDGRPFIVMELVAGGSLAERLRLGPLPEAHAVRLTLEVLSALDAAHAAGIVHRDIKPANILFSPDGSVKVADFGIAKALVPDAGGRDLTTTNAVIGTPRYLPPERAEGHTATVQSDLWGVGVVLHEALAGSYPFPGDTPLAAVVAAQRGEATPIESLRPGVSPAVAAVAARALGPDPASRYGSAAEMAADLSAAATASGEATALLDPLTVPMAAGGEAWGAATTSLPGPPGPDARAGAGGGTPGSPTRRSPAVWAAGAAVALALLLLYLLWPGGGHPAAPARPARSVTTTTAAATPVTQAVTTTTVTCAGLQAQRQALDHQPPPPPGAPAPSDASHRALDNAKRALDQQIQDLCGNNGGPAGGGGGGGG